MRTLAPLTDAFRVSSVIGIALSVFLLAGHATLEAGRLSAVAHGLPATTASIDQGKLTASDGQRGDNFGFSVSQDTSGIEKWAIIGAPFDDDYGDGSGAAYIFALDHTTWRQVAKLHASDAGSHQAFGYAVAISGNFAIVGGGGAHQAAYIFFRGATLGSRWTEVARLVVNDSPGGFGSSVAIDRGVAVVGTNPGLSDLGAAYVFERQGTSTVWSEVAKLQPVDAHPGQGFGGDVAIHRGSSGPFLPSGRNDRIVVAAPSDDIGGEDAGAAYIFSRNQGGTNAWGQVAKLTASDAAPQDGLGHAVSISDRTAIVTTYLKRDAQGHVGGGAAGYVFKQIGSVWKQVDKLVPGPTNPGTFGADAAIGGDDTILISASSDSERGLFAGSVFVFRRNPYNPSSPDKWFVVDKLIATDGGNYDSFGGAVSLQGDRAMIGAIGFIGDDAPPGAAYFCQIFFSQPPSDAACRRSRVADPILNAQVSMTDVTTSLSGSQFTISATITNHGTVTIRDLFFQVMELTGGNVLLNADGGPGGAGATMTPDNGTGGFLIRGASIRVTFVIGLASKRPFRFLVDVRGDTKQW
jgi:hypothetical protein